MNKKIVASLTLSIVVSFLIIVTVSNYFAEKEIANQRSEYTTRGIAFGETLAP